MRILLLADDCNPQWPSLPIVGYKAAKALAEKVEVVVATHVRNGDNIEQAGFGSAKVEYIDNEYIARRHPKAAELIHVYQWVPGRQQKAKFAVAGC